MTEEILYASEGKGSKWLRIDYSDHWTESELQYIKKVSIVTKEENKK